MSAPKPQISSVARGEAIFLLACVFFGLFLLPAGIYTVGQMIFGDYGGTGIAEFYGRIYSGIGNGDGIIWFLVLSPYIGLQTLRLTIRLFRRSRKRALARSV